MLFFLNFLLISNIDNKSVRMLYHICFSFINDVYDFKNDFTETALTMNHNLKNTDISQVSCWFEPCLLYKHPSNTPLVNYHYSFIFRSQGLSGKRIKITTCFINICWCRQILYLFTSIHLKCTSAEFFSRSTKYFILFFTGTIKISSTFSHFILVKWRVRYCWKIKCARVLIAHQISSTKGVLTKFPLEAIDFFPDMNFFATWKTNETKFVMQNSNPNDKSLMKKKKSMMKALNTLLLAKDTLSMNMLDIPTYLLLLFFRIHLNLYSIFFHPKRQQLLTLTTSAEDTASIFWVTASGEW